MEIDGLALSQIADDGPDGLLIQFLGVACASSQVFLHRELEVIGPLDDCAHMGFAIFDASKIQVQADAKIVQEDVFRIFRNATAKAGAPVDLAIGNVAAVGLPASQVTDILRNAVNHAERTQGSDIGLFEDVPIGIQHFVMVLFSGDEVVDLCRRGGAQDL